MRHYQGPQFRRGRSPSTRSRAPFAAPAVIGAGKPDDALTVAVRLYRSPGLARGIRHSPLPPEIILVIRIAAGCPISCAFAVAQTGLDEPALMRMATLYLLVVLFGQESDPHRTLGLAAGASPELVQDHRKWLLKWLHPDRNPNPNLAGLSVRVLAASAALVGTSQPAAPVAEPQGAEVPTPAATEGAERRRKHQLRHVWVPLRVGG